MPDATGLELIAQELRDRDSEGVLDTTFFREKAAITVTRETVQATLEHLRGKGYGFMASVHGVDYFPEEPRLGVHYELLDMSTVDRITVKVRVPLEDPHVPSVTGIYPTANWHERETWDFFGIVFDGHPALTRIEMPDDWPGHPQRKDYPLGGIPVEYKGAQIPPPDERRSYA